MRMLAGGLLALGLSSADAVTVHTWVDAEGHRHFSDEPPPTPSPSHEALEFATTDPGSGDDEQSIVNQWRRLRAEREADAKLALERERLRQASRSVPPPVAEPSIRNGPYFPSGYLFPPYPQPVYGYGDGHGHGHSHQPSQPVRRDPFAVPIWPRERAR